MSQINQLSTTNSSDLSSGDLFALWKANQSDARKISVTELLEYFRTNLTNATFQTTISTPSDGFTVTVTQDGQDRWELLRPTGSLATGTVVLPAPSVAVDNQEITFTSTAQINSFTVNGNGATEVNGAPLVFSAGDCVTFRYNTLTTSWYKVA